jgi:hypothetical protein
MVPSMKKGYGTFGGDATVEKSNRDFITNYSNIPTAGS